VDVLATDAISAPDARRRQDTVLDPVRIVCGVTWKSDATSATVSSCESAISESRSKVVPTVPLELAFEPSPSWWTWTLKLPLPHQLSKMLDGAVESLAL
jgi:hypothetical protein